MPTGLTRDAGWEIGVSKTLPLPAGTLWDFVVSPEGVGIWLGGTRGPLPTEKGARYETEAGVTGEVRGYRPGDRVRLTHGTTTVQVTVSASGPARAVLAFHEEHLPDAAARAARRTHWKAVLSRMEAALTA
ncbi:SRPBCC domain-containing protein [Streptomyces sp. NPDC015131]|uniref:SRPBCC domain-containing protein n=1 Tax=Streptomyces sp. NPDC015131 TaxID=3364941 RepID=UPI0036FD67A9